MLMFPHLNHGPLKDRSCLNIPYRAIKGHLISKGLFDFIISTKKNNEFYSKDVLGWIKKVNKLYITNYLK